MARGIGIGLGIVAAIFFALAGGHRAAADEGQWPLSMLAKIDLKAEGFEIELAEIYDPGGVGLVDAIVRVGGATGSFVSPQGLILTNHHVAFAGVQAASTPERDYIEKGFVAGDRAAEIPARGYTCRITVGYRDVSKEVLASISEGATPEERTKAVRQRSRELVSAAEKERPGTTAEVSEMFQGKSYVLFFYRELLDVRLVCVPPRSVGEYGGETDNWVWPRHTGDFAFLRAYVGPDGEPAAFSEDNVPYEPKRHLEVNAEGVDEGDLVFLLGYPGRTYRHQSAAFLDFEEQERMPYFVARFQDHLAAMEELSARSAGDAIKLANEMKWRANVEKNYRGKLLGMRRLGLADARRSEDDMLRAWIAADEERSQRYAGVLEGIESHYRAAREAAPRDLVLGRLPRATTVLRLAFDVVNGARERAKPDVERAPEYRDREARTLAATRERLLRDAVPAADLHVLARDLEELRSLDPSLGVAGLAGWLASGSEGVDVVGRLREALAATTLYDAESFAAMCALDGAGVEALRDPIVRLALVLEPALREKAARDREDRGRIDGLMALYLEARQAFKGGDFIPDANSTLRLTYGRIRSYEPRDAVLHRPVTTVAGILEKATGREPFDPPQRLRELISAEDWGRFAHPRLGTVPVGILYDCDTTGGNSGSPVIDSKGRLVGVNFDRAFEATINDYRWSSRYSRSIGVDIRYALWITEKLMGAGHVLEEMGVEP